MSEIDEQILALPSVQAEPSASRRSLATVIELQTKLAEAQRRLAAIKDERSAAAYDASNSTGQSPARRHLTSLRQAAAAAEDEIVDLSAAIVTAGTRLAAARAAARASAAVEGARHAEDIAEKLRAKGVECDDLLTKFAIRFGEMSALVDALAKEGFAPNVRLVHIACERALSSALLPTRLAPTPGMLPPSLRTSMSTVAARYSDQAITQARRVRGEAA
jgi:hypothetical protein